MRRTHGDSPKDAPAQKHLKPVEKKPAVKKAPTKEDEKDSIWTGSHFDRHSPIHHGNEADEEAENWTDWRYNTHHGDHTAPIHDQEYAHDYEMAHYDHLYGMDNSDENLGDWRYHTGHMAPHHMNEFSDIIGKITGDDPADMYVPQQ